jgi:hypothetical protein
MTTGVPEAEREVQADLRRIAARLDALDDVTVPRLPEKGEPARCPECGSERRGAPSCGCGWHDGSPT